MTAGGGGEEKPVGGGAEEVPAGGVCLTMLVNRAIDEKQVSKDWIAYLVKVIEGLSSAEPLTQGHFFHMQTRITTTTKITVTTAAIKNTSPPTTIAVTSSDPPEGEGLVDKSEDQKNCDILNYRTLVL